MALIWYAAYGSNLSRERLMCYLEGGTPTGAGRANPGASDPSPPRADALDHISHPLVLARRSSVWGAEGGVAFVGRDPVAGVRTIVRRWLITADQFVDVTAQENVVARARLEPHLDPDRLMAPEPFVVRPGGWYGLVVPCGRVDGVPVVTLTADADVVNEPRVPPAPAYLATMARGLTEAGMSSDEVTAYLSGAAGVGPDAVEAALAAHPGSPA